MSNDVRDLQTYWPFLPTETLLLPVPVVVDASIIVPLAMAEPDINPENGDFVQAYLVRLTDAQATIEITVTEGGISDVSYLVPVIKDEAAACNGSYVLLNTNTDNLVLPWEGRLRFNPACVRIIPQLPTLSIRERYGFQLTDKNTATDGAYIPFTNSIKLHGSLNISTTYDTGELSILGTDTPSGQYPPFAEIDNNTVLEGGKGLRCLNGHTGDVSITCKGSDVLADIDKLNNTIRVTLGVRE